MKHLLCVAVAASTLVVACGGGPAPAHPGNDPNAGALPSPRPAAGDAGAGGDAARVDPVRGARPPEHHVKIIEATESEEHELTPLIPLGVRTRLEECHPTGGGKLRIRVHREPGKVAFDAEPSAALDPTERRCVLEALSPLRRDDVASTLWSGATVPATGFDSLLTIEW
jgi:hypothetical protein